MGDAPKRATVPPEALEQALQSNQSLSPSLTTARREALNRLADLRRTLQQQTCSSTWLDDCWRTGTAFPPPAEVSPMVHCRCERCQQSGRLWPAIYGAPAKDVIPVVEPAPTKSVPEAHDGPMLSYECYLESLDPWAAANLPSSPSGMALRAVREGRIRLRRGRVRLGSRRRCT